MQKKITIVATIVLAIVMLSSCGSNRCTGRKDCNGNKKTYNKSGGFWM